MNQESTDSALILRIGDEDIDDVSGVQTYRIEYTADGLLNPANAQHSGDELYWNVIGAGWEIPLGDITVAVTGPAAVEGAVCFAGPYGSTTPCTSATFAGSSSSFTQDLVPVGDAALDGHRLARGHVPRGRADPRRQARPAGPGAAGLRRSASSALLVLVGGGIFAVRPDAPRRPRQGLPRPDPGPAPGRQPARRRHGRVPRQARRRLRAVPAARGRATGGGGHARRREGRPRRRHRHPGRPRRARLAAHRGGAAVQPEEEGQGLDPGAAEEQGRLAAAVRGRAAAPRSSRRRPRSSSPT